VPGQVHNTTRKLVLKGVDGVVFVADSQRRWSGQHRLAAQPEENLAEMQLSSTRPAGPPVQQADLPDVRPTSSSAPSTAAGGSTTRPGGTGRGSSRPSRGSRADPDQPQARLPWGHRARVRAQPAAVAAPFSRRAATAAAAARRRGRAGPALAAPAHAPGRRLPPESPAAKPGPRQPEVISAPRQLGRSPQRHAAGEPRHGPDFARSGRRRSTGGEIHRTRADLKKPTSARLSFPSACVSRTGTTGWSTGSAISRRDQGPRRSSDPAPPEHLGALQAE
jgi:hypothetical protein